MSFIENNLNNSEKLEYFSKTSLKPTIGILAVFWAIVVFGIFLGEAPSNEKIEFVSWSILGSVVYFVYCLVFRFFTEYGATNKRVISKMGIIRRDIEEMDLKSIESVNIKQSVLGRILNYGSILISGRGTSLIVFQDIDNPVNVRKKIQNKS